MRRRMLWFVAGALLATGLSFAVIRGRPPRVVQLPPEIVEKIVEVEVVKEIPGPETVIERVSWKTKLVEVPPHIVAKMALELCTYPDPEVIELVHEVQPELHGQIEIEADKHLGLDGDRIVAGWVGRASCVVNDMSLFSADIDEEVSVALSEIQTRDLLPRSLPTRFNLGLGISTEETLRGRLEWFRAGSRWGAWAAVDYRLDPESFKVVQGFFTSDDPSIEEMSDDRWTLAAGVSLRLGKK